MSAGIVIRDQKPLFMYAGQVPWHGIGNPVETEQTADGAIRKSGLNYGYYKTPGFIITAGGKQKQIPGVHAIVRDYDDQPVGHVGNVYHIIQPVQCFDFLDSIIGHGQAVYHTAGAIYSGRTIFMVVKFPDNIKVGPDVIEKYLLLSNTYDGQSSLSLIWTPVRVVCQNTYELSFQSVLKSVKIRHTASYVEKVQEARRVLELTDQYYKVMETKFNVLLDNKFSTTQMEQLTEKLFPATNRTDGQVVVSKQTKRTRETVQNLFLVGAGQKEVAGTKWAALNAVTDFVDHAATVRVRTGVEVKDARMNSALFGAGATLRQRAYDLLSV